MMVNMRAAITLLTKKWADAHSLAVKEKAAEYILGANSTSVNMTSMTLLPAPTLELDISNIAVCLGDFYQGLLGCELLCNYNEVFGTATITLPRPD